MLLLALVLELAMFSTAYAAYLRTVDIIDVERLADAIKRAENSDSHPYGILKAYCLPNDPDGQCRKGCIQTINKRLRMYKSSGSTLDFITYLGTTYCPVGAKNDPTGLNRYWATNVKYFYKKGA